MNSPALVAIGASEGGLDALKRLAAGLRATTPVIWCVVLHIDAHDSILPQILERAGPLPARHPRHGDQLATGCIHVAPPDHHLLVGDGTVLLSRGPRVNRTRPAVDPLFRAAAERFGTRAIGVVLTGNLDDGALGLREIRRCGGQAVVQDPLEAAVPSMPRTALDAAGADHCVPLAEMPALLLRLADEVTARHAARGDRDGS